MISFQNNISFIRLGLCLIILLNSFSEFSQVPLLNSRPSNTNEVIYLDFDGHVTSGTSWNSGNIINALPSTMSNTNIELIWKRVMEDFIPFDVNITTDSSRFNSAQVNKRMRVVITPSSAWYGNNAGGVAYLNSFTWGGTPGTPCWVFENQLGYNTKYIAEAASHESGHTLSLKHQSTYSMTPTCTKTAEYNPGQGTGVTSWAPIMGVGYYKNVTTWYDGTSATSCNTIQYDHGNVLPGITSNNFLSFYPDDAGNQFTNGKALNLNVTALLDSGLISTPSDIDAFTFTLCNNRYISIDAKPWALDTVNYSGANLDINLVLRDAVTNSIIASDAQIGRLNARLAANLAPGSYYFTIDGDGSANYSDYGSLGRYYFLINTTNATLYTNTIVTSSVICQGKATTLSYTSNGAPNTFQWQVSGPMTTSSTAQYPSVTFASAGVYTITFMGLSNFVTCPVTKTIVVNPSPIFSLSPSQIVCKGATVAFTASPGAGYTYTWMPGNLVGANQLFTPTLSTHYTVTARIGVCTNTAVTTLSLSPDFTLNLTASDTLFCPGDTIFINASGANNYFFLPGGQSGNQITVMPLAPVVYTVTGINQDGCLKQDSIALKLKQCNSVNISSYTLEDEFFIYPNPANEKLYLVVTDEKKGREFQLSVVNSLGQLLIKKSERLKDGTLEIKTESLPEGLYFLQMSSGEIEITKRFVVSR